MGCGQSNEAVAAVPFPIGDDLRYNKDYHYESWSKQMDVKGLKWCQPLNVKEAVAVVNWAYANGLRVRVKGRGHNWSPITIAPQNEDETKDVILIQLDKIDKDFKVVEKDERAGGKPTASVNLGIAQEDFLTLLELADRKETGTDKSAPGFGVSHCPAPNSITLGGMMAINGHGTAIPSERETEIVGEGVSYGSYSNRVVAITIVAYNAEKNLFEEKEILRSTNGGKDIAPFLTHCGRAFVARATFQVEPNYYMRCRSFMGIDWRTMFAPLVDGKPQEKSMAWFMERHGRVEAIWYPFTDKPWLKVWTVTDGNCPKNSRKVDQTCNYPFSDELPDFLTNIVNLLTGAWGDESKRVNINKDIDDQVLAVTQTANVVDDETVAKAVGVKVENDQPVETTAEEARAAVLPSDEEVGITAEDSEEDKQRKRREHAEKKLAEDEAGKKLIASAKALDQKHEEAKTAEPAEKHTVDTDDAEVPDYEKEEGHPLDGADLEVFDSFADGFWSIFGLAKFGGATPFFGKAIYQTTLDGLRKDHSYDIWGPSKNTLIYVKDTTIKVTANGYAILCRRAHVGNVMHEFATMFHSMLEEYQRKYITQAYPIAMPLEIRVTGLDDPAPIGDGTWTSPSLSALHVTPEEKAAGFDCCLWLDVLSMPGNFGANNFYADMEQRLLNHKTFNGPDAKLRPEWSKGWGYDKKKGPWAGEAMLEHTRATLPEWNTAMKALNAVDVPDDAKAKDANKKVRRVFRNAWMENFFKVLPEKQ